MTSPVAKAFDLLKVAKCQWLKRSELREACDGAEPSVGLWISEALAHGMLVERQIGKGPKQYTVARAWGGTADV